MTLGQLPLLLCVDIAASIKSLWCHNRIMKLVCMWQANVSDDSVALLGHSRRQNYSWWPPGLSSEALPRALLHREGGGRTAERE